MKSNLIFDVGMHRGNDTRFYLEKGFEVVAIEANPALVTKCTEIFKEYLLGGRLKIIGNAISDIDNQSVTFYVNDEKDDWSSLYKGASEKGITSSREITVNTITLNSLFAEHGIPYYLKCDIEGGDESVATQLIDVIEKPQYVSFEITSISILAALWASGYRKFQLVNQAFNFLTSIPAPPLEGNYAHRIFDGHSSGLFGRELPSNKWRNIDEISFLYTNFVSLREQYEQLCMGWLDIHATF